MARVEGVANPNDHFGFRGQRQDLGVKNLGTCGGESVRFVV